RYIDEFAAAGADIITVHAEACTHLHRAIQMIKAHGIKAGVSINPATSPECLRYVMDDVDLILCMSVNPGFGGQKFIPATLEKLSRVREMITASGRDIMLEVDGGVNLENAAEIRAAGADVLVAGNAVFTHPSPVDAIRVIRGE
ncbi:MAG: ribulose-phosphate 3-epimerase, partial [Clostridia bacterium]|nr:ribulose-phosphate 3-epimerase [Clostridia bacterium]